MTKKNADEVAKPRTVVYRIRANEDGHGAKEERFEFQPLGGKAVHIVPAGQAPLKQFVSQHESEEAALEYLGGIFTTSDGWQLVTDPPLGITFEQVEKGEIEFVMYEASGYAHLPTKDATESELPVELFPLREVVIRKAGFDPDKMEVGAVLLLSRWGMHETGSIMVFTSAHLSGKAKDKFAISKRPYQLKK